jgi:diketogulonate reductase-like aldo/keto reductase
MAERTVKNQGALNRLVRGTDGFAMPAFGLGTWRMGERAKTRESEIEALKIGLSAGVRLIDTAEMYGSGGAEEIVAEAVAGHRAEIFIVSKVMPQNASRTGTIKAAEASLKRLGTDYIDLYLLHWPGAYPLEETLEGFERLVRQGKIRRYGLSNFDAGQLKAARALTLGSAIAANQVLYNLARRGIEHDLLPLCRKNGVVVMAYSPLDQGGLPARPALKKIAERHGTTPETVAIAWTMRHDQVVSIPKAVRLEHLRADLAAATLRLSAEDLAALDHAFPAPKGPSALEIL